MGYSIGDTVCLTEGMTNSVGYSRGDTDTLWVIVEGILPFCGLQQRGYCHSVGYSRGDTATLWVTAEGILPLSECQRRDTVTLCVTHGYTVLYKSSISYNMKYLTNRWFGGWWQRIYILTSHI